MADTDVKVNITAEDRTDAAFRSLDASIRSLEAGFTKLATAAVTFAGGAFVSALVASVKAAEDAEIAQRKLEAVLRATGNTTGFTTDQLNQLAENLARSSRFDDSQFREATATLVRFGNIAGENLERVLRLAGDYAALTGGSLTSATETLGRALSNPAEGLKKLERNFGDLSPEIERTIREKMALGDRAGALGVALDALEAKIGGSDASLNTGLTASFRSLGKTLNGILETLGRSANGGMFSRLIQEIDQSFLGLKRTLSDESLFRNMGMIATFLTNPQAFLAFRQIGGMTMPDVRPDSTIRFDTAAFEADLNRTVSAIASAQQQVTRESLKESERLNAERARMNEQARQMHLRGEEAALQAEHEKLNETMRQNADVRRAAMKEAEAIRQLGVKSEEAALIAEHELLQEAMLMNYRARVADNKKQEELLKEQGKYWQGFLGGIESGFRDVFDKIFSGQINSWTDFVGALRNIFKRILLDFIYQSLARPFALNIVATVAGSLGMSGLANAATGAGSPAGSILGNVGSAALSGSGLGVATIAEFLAGASGSFMGPAAAGSAASMGASFAAFMTNPATLAVLAAVVIAVAVMSRRGGPKEGGSAFGTFDANGNFAPGFAPGTQNGRFYTPNGGDVAMQEFTQGIGSAFADTLARLGGGSSAGFGFGFGFDRDPRGTANSRVSGVVTNPAGQTIFEVINREAGRSEEDLQQAMGLIGRQALLAALQNSGLPEAVRAILSLVDAASATADEIDSILQLAQAFVQVTHSAREISVSDVLQRASVTVIDSFRAQGESLVELANSSSLTTQSLATLAQATGSYRASAEALIISFENIANQIDAMFNQTARNIMMSGMDAAARYAFIEAETQRLIESLLRSIDPNEISRLSGQINQNISQLFSSLSPEEQAAARDTFLARLENVNTATQERLRQLQQEAAAEANRQLAEVRRIMEEMAVEQKSAASTQQDAANKQLTAANTPRTFNINVDISGGSSVVTAGG